MNNSFLSIINGVSLVISFKERERERGGCKQFYFNFYFIALRSRVYLCKAFFCVCPQTLCEDLPLLDCRILHGGY